MSFFLPALAFVEARKEWFEPMNKEIIEGRNGLKVKLTESKKNGKTKLSAFIIDPVTLVVLSKTPKTCTFEQDEDRSAKRIGLINKACADWMKKHKAKAVKSTVVGEKSLARSAFDQIDWADPYFTRRWRAESTRRNARTLFERNVLPFVDCHQGEECTRTDVEEFHAALVDNVLENHKAIQYFLFIASGVLHLMQHPSCFIFIDGKRAK